MMDARIPMPTASALMPVVSQSWDYFREFSKIKSKMALM
jgi:hypothetical protein